MEQYVNRVKEWVTKIEERFRDQDRQRATVVTKTKFQVIKDRIIWGVWICTTYRHITFLQAHYLKYNTKTPVSILNNQIRQKYCLKLKVRRELWNRKVIQDKSLAKIDRRQLSAVVEARTPTWPHTQPITSTRTKINIQHL